ncbi:4-hydroxy-3-methylbut-2-enyl diphosphate reductase [Carboxylicivirga taeanensis]|uniref:4-hydroxy-3-methylbut-2-enyl diphosphate reductase n=1 Tax=Carboxylicivirga taeanensis TaxID=1416875 RepID=UPI003F6E1884
MVTVAIDNNSGFCFGVQRAINQASALLEKGSAVYCVGDIVHNEAESKRLNNMGMQTIRHDGINVLKGKTGTVLFRAHGEPPQSYQLIKEAGLQLQDATCPVVLKLQQRIKDAYLKQKANNGQIVIYGQRGHAEVVGLLGQTNNEAIVIEEEADIARIDFERPVELFAQTTKSPDILKNIVDLLKKQCRANFSWHNTTCKQVTGRVPRIKQFAATYEVVVFVGGQESSNAKILFQACREANPHSHFVSSPEEVKLEWFSQGVKKVGVCGATSTPQWLMEQVAEQIKSGLK